MKTPSVPMAREGYPFILFSAFLTLVFALLQIPAAALGGLALTTFVCWFFRDPERTPPDGNDAIVSPADGKIIIAREIDDDRFFHARVYKVSIFMNVFNVHVNRFPLSGTVQRIKHRPGRFYAADSTRGALQNEYCALTVQARQGFTYGVVQVAGLIARRIICWAEKNDEVQTGHRYGLIRFGSRVDLYLPLEVALKVKVGDKVKAGETILAECPADGV